MVSALILAGLLASQMPAPAPVSMRAPRTAMYVTAATDIATTLIVLKQGGRETNRFIGPQPSAAKLVGLKVGMVLAVEAWNALLRKFGLNDEARLNYWIVAVIQGAASVWNITQFRF